ncbi:hypothetical protein [Pseudofrankia sp. BMG5.37]|uniref:hypothetical protein n=1 Tax=Pseudofrankia sp. BMG5.37 TaxID=3050035 RepID=UPI00289455E3|nr:hypothetical protein [Pseudofrankia sp. BMG5.37]MDT3442504.1 hypothetical protein [Pseudofrankia sp. BMG5.37]
MVLAAAGGAGRRGGGEVAARNAAACLACRDRGGLDQAVAQFQDVVDLDRVLGSGDAQREQDSADRVEDRGGDGLDRDLV